MFCAFCKSLQGEGSPLLDLRRDSRSVKDRRFLLTTNLLPLALRQSSPGPPAVAERSPQQGLLQQLELRVLRRQQPITTTLDDYTNDLAIPRSASSNKNIAHLWLCLGRLLSRRRTLRSWRFRCSFRGCLKLLVDEVASSEYDASL